jgi:hypothetical protein
MEGYEAITSDDRKVGQVVDIKGDNVIVEHGLLRKTQHAIPTAFVHADDSEKVVRVSVSSDIVESSPKLDDGQVDRRAVAEHYGLAAGEPAPETEGYGDMLPDDPALSAEQQGLRTGVEPAAQQRAAMREGRDEPGPRGRQIIPPDPHEGP